jgi:hypothetical protein
MNNLLRHIHEHTVGDLDNALIIGAGTGSQLGDWRQLGCRQLLLAEAHPQLAEALGQRLRSEQGERLLSVAVTPNEQPVAVLHSLNNLAYSSLNQAADLFTYYPNLRRDEALQVPARSLEAVVAEQALDHQQTHVLLIAAPGQALQLLQATPVASLHAFTWIIVECNCEPLYQGDASDRDIIGHMKTLGFNLAIDNPDAIFPQSQLLFERNATRLVQQRLDSEADEQKRQPDAFVRPFAAYEVVAHEDAALATTHYAQSPVIAALQAELAALRQLNAELTLSAEVQEKKLADLTQAHDAQAQLLDERQALVEALSKTSSELAAERDALIKKNAELAEACATQTKLADERKTQLEQISDQRDHLQKAVSEHNEANQGQVQTLEREAVEYQHRQRLLEEQLLKAEGQLELVKDLLLREPGF